MYLTSDTGWTIFNNLLNQIRESVVQKSLSLLSNGSIFYLPDPVQLCAEEDSKVISISRDMNNVFLTVQDSEFEENEYEPNYEGFQATDLLNILETLENELKIHTSPD